MSHRKVGGNRPVSKGVRINRIDHWSRYKFSTTFPFLRHVIGTTATISWKRFCICFVTHKMKNALIMWTVVSHLRAQTFYHAWKRLMQRVSERKVNKSMIRSCFFTFKGHIHETNHASADVQHTKIATELIAGWSNTAGKSTVGLSYQTRNTRLEDANFVQGVQECLSKKLALRARTPSAALARYTPNYKQKWKKEKAK